MASQALWPMGDTDGDAGALQSGLGAAATSDQQAASLDAIIKSVFARDGLPPSEANPDGSYVFP